jgi:hypothetical protein
MELSALAMDSKVEELSDESLRSIRISIQEEILTKIAFRPPSMPEHPLASVKTATLRRLKGSLKCGDDLDSLFETLELDTNRFRYRYVQRLVRDVKGLQYDLPATSRSYSSLPHLGHEFLHNLRVYYSHLHALYSLAAIVTRVDNDVQSSSSWKRVVTPRKRVQRTVKYYQDYYRSVLQLIPPLTKSREPASPSQDHPLYRILEEEEDEEEV